MKRIFCLIFLSLVLLYFISFFLNYTLRNAPFGIYKKFHQIFEDKKYYDVWIIGSSRAETAFETDVISKKTNLEFFNAGIHGAKPPQTYYLLKHILNHHPSPKCVIFDVDVHNISDKDSILNIEQLAPFMHHSELRMDLVKIDSRLKYAYYIPMYELSFYGLRGIAKWIRTIFHLPGRYDTTFQATGCYHSHTNYQKEHYPDTTHPFYFHTVNIAYMDSIVKICRKNQVTILFSVSPVFQPDSNIYNAVKQLKKFCTDRNVYVFDLSDIPSISNDMNKFSDKYHLKFNGSLELSNIFADSLIAHLKHQDKKFIPVK